jgi:hypothetical protein
MHQSDLPKFISIQFCPGYAYTVANTTSSASGRYIALAEDGRAYVHCLNTSEWEMIGEFNEDE